MGLYAKNYLLNVDTIFDDIIDTFECAIIMNISVLTIYPHTLNNSTYKGSCSVLSQ